MNTPSLIGGGMPVASGDDAVALREAQAYQWNRLLKGEAYLEIPLNGGSDTRRAVREHWQEECESLGIPFRAIAGHTLIIGHKA